ncbi:ASCH domain-containing protein [Streptomyces sp. NPDC007883]|uniref:ASCH domain-containing protein n=1 Tax=Streptomyces sp. NPDC007883 TaxID=3155116 RepID=UPI0033FF9089
MPRPLRDRLVSAVLSGEKVSTTGLSAEGKAEGKGMPSRGERYALIDSAGRATAELEVTDVRVTPLVEVGPRHALDEDEGHRSVAERRTAHERFRPRPPQMPEALDDPGVIVGDTTVVVAERFRAR